MVPRVFGVSQVLETAVPLLRRSAREVLFRVAGEVGLEDRGWMGSGSALLPAGVGGPNTTRAYQRRLRGPEQMFGPGTHRWDVATVHRPTPADVLAE